MGYVYNELICKQAECYVRFSIILGVRPPKLDAVRMWSDAAWPRWASGLRVQLRIVSATMYFRHLQPGHRFNMIAQLLCSDCHS